ncbi:Uncharacterised protein [Mycobacteroides abscessus]|nr:Uncharacterised protein [Mycobacteroides abscessus]
MNVVHISRCLSLVNSSGSRPCTAGRSLNVLMSTWAPSPAIQSVRTWHASSGFFASFEMPSATSMPPTSCGSGAPPGIVGNRKGS